MTPPKGVLFASDPPKRRSAFRPDSELWRERPGRLRSLGSPKGLIPRRPRVAGAKREVAADACDKTVSDCLPAHPRPTEG